MNKTKQKLRSGQPALGGWIMMAHPSIAEIMAAEGFDWISVDLEHTSTSLGDVHEIALALKGTNCDLLVRLPSCDPVLAKRVLDIGAAGIIVPSVNTPEQAQQAAAIARFPPEGVRGVSLSRATRYGSNFSGYFENHNRDVLVVVMLEHHEGAANADAILATPGIDAAFIGPYSIFPLPLSLAGQLQHPKVMAAEKQILTACAKHGVAPGIHVVPVDPEQVRRRIAEGFRFVACGLDTSFIQHGCRAMLKPPSAHA